MILLTLHLHFYWMVNHKLLVNDQQKGMWDVKTLLVVKNIVFDYHIPYDIQAFFLKKNYNLLSSH